MDEEKVFELNVSLQSENAHLCAATREEIGHFPNNYPSLFMWEDWNVTGNFVDDFIFCIGGIICKTDVAVELSNNFTGLDILPVKMTKHPKELTCKLNRLRWLPKEEVSLSIVTTTNEVEPLERSSITYKYFSGKKFISNIDGISEMSGDIIIPREAGKGLFFKKETVKTDFFKPANNKMLLCTQKVKDALEKFNYGSLVLLEVGSIIK